MTDTNGLLLLDTMIGIAKRQALARPRLCSSTRGRGNLQTQNHLDVGPTHKYKCKVVSSEEEEYMHAINLLVAFSMEVRHGMQPLTAAKAQAAAGVHRHEEASPAALTQTNISAPSQPPPAVLLQEARDLAEMLYREGLLTDSPQGQRSLPDSPTRRFACDKGIRLQKL